jgi:hypothetical protein
MFLPECSSKTVGAAGCAEALGICAIGETGRERVWLIKNDAPIYEGEELYI